MRLVSECIRNVCFSNTGIIGSID